MGLFDLFWKKKKSLSPDELRELLTAAASDAPDTLVALCLEHDAAIRAAFPGWRKIPEAARGDPQVTQRHVRGIITVAHHYAQAGDPALLALLQNQGGPNPLADWQRDLRRVEELLAGDGAREAVEILQAALTRGAGLTGGAAGRLQAMTHGYLGRAWFTLGELGPAREHTARALTLCEAGGDLEGVAIYRRSLQQLGRGQTEVIFTSSDGRTLRLEDLRGATGTFRWEVIEGVVPHQATELHQRGRKAAAAGRHDEALRLLAEAREAAPDWPYPVYDAAFTWLLKGDLPRALALYQQVVQMSPRGFMTALAAVHTLEREVQGALPVGTWLRFLSTEWKPAKKREILEQLLAGAPRYAPALKGLAQLEEDLQVRAEGLQRALDADPDADTRGVVRVNLALTLHAQGARQRAVDLLMDLALDPASTYTTEHMAKVALAQLAVALDA